MVRKTLITFVVLLVLSVFAFAADKPNFAGS